MKYLLFCDYDGTLTPIVKTPGLAKFSITRQQFLKKLADSHNLIFSLVSGRSISDLKTKAGILNAYYVGNHGFEVKGPGLSMLYPKVKKFIPVFAKIKKQLKKALQIQGLLIEDKGLSLSIHYRLVPKAKLKAFNKEFLKILSPYIQEKKIKLTEGKKVFEIRPPLDWNKGKAVLWVWKALSKKLKTRLLPIYIGDDTTDEDAFRVLGEKGLTFRVGKKKKTLAKKRLKDVSAVYNYLVHLCSCDMCTSNKEAY